MSVCGRVRVCVCVWRARCCVCSRACRVNTQMYIRACPCVCLTVCVCVCVREEQPQLSLNPGIWLQWVSVRYLVYLHIQRHTDTQEAHSLTYVLIFTRHIDS